MDYLELTDVDATANYSVKL